MTPKQVENPENEGKVKKYGSKAQKNRKRGRERTPIQREEDARLIASMRRQNMSDQQIADILNERGGDYLPVSRRTVTLDRNKMLTEFRLARTDDLDAWMVEQLSRLEEIEQAAWAAYRVTLEESKATEVRELEREGDDDKKGSFIERETRTMTSSASPSHQHLQTALACIKHRSEILGLKKYQTDINVRIDKHETHEVRLYKNWSPENWDQIIEEGEFE